MRTVYGVSINGLAREVIHNSGIGIPSIRDFYRIAWFAPPPLGVSCPYLEEAWFMLYCLAWNELCQFMFNTRKHLMKQEGCLDRQGCGWVYDAMILLMVGVVGVVFQAWSVQVPGSISCITYPLRIVSPVSSSPDLPRIPTIAV